MKGNFRAVFQGFESTLSLFDFAISAEMEGPYDIQAKPQGGNRQTIRKIPIGVSRS